MSDRVSAQDLAALLLEAGRAHHDAYRETDGVDPEWALWYSGYLQAHLGQRLGRSITRSELTYLLIHGERSRGAAASDAPWNEYYALLILESDGGA